MTTSNLITRNIVNTLTGERGAVVRVSRDGQTCTVLLRDTGKLVSMPSAHVEATRGRPIKLVKGLCRADVDDLVGNNPEFRVRAIRELFGRQTEDERGSLATRWDNRVGFRADDARRGSMLALKSACAWTEDDHTIAIDCLLPYTGTQLWDLASEYLSEDGPSVEAPAPAVESVPSFDGGSDDTAADLIASLLA